MTRSSAIRAQRNERWASRGATLGPSAAKLGLEIPTDIFERARERLAAGIHHRHAILAFAAWPLAHWRMDPLDERDFEWFEDKYPGWYAEYGALWEAFRRSTEPRARAARDPGAGVELGADDMIRLVSGASGWSELLSAVGWR